jgi:formylmethanofuran dehydrogenase subunit E-like metal-binding protein
MPTTRRRTFSLILALLLLWSAIPAKAALSASGLDQAKAALEQAMADVGEKKGSQTLLVLTNAAYARLDGDSAVGFLDAATAVTGATFGARSLLCVHSSMLSPLWFSLYSPASNTIVYTAQKDGAFSSQKIDASPEHLFAPDNWKAAGSGIIGGSLFSVASISLAWAVTPDYMSLQAASFHDHFCPGVNYGLILGDYIEKRFPLGPGDAYVFAVAPSKCAADALQVIYNTTTGKGGDYGMGISEADLAKYAVNGVKPTAVVMRVNRKNDVCDALALGIDSARLYADIKMNEADLAPEGGQKNPLFYIARTRASREICRLPKEQRMGYVVELAKTSGKADLADKITANDPYARVFGK